MNNKFFVRKEKAFYEQLNIFIKDKVEEKKEFDKKFFYTISSFFAFSILLVQFTKGTVVVPFLLIAWVSNLIALICHLIAYLMAAKTHSERIKDFLNMNGEDDEKNKFFKENIIESKSKWAKITAVTEIISYG